MGCDCSLGQQLTQIAQYFDCLEPVSRFAPEEERESEEMISVDQKHFNIQSTLPIKKQKRVSFEKRPFYYQSFEEPISDISSLKEERYQKKQNFLVESDFSQIEYKNNKTLSRPAGQRRGRSMLQVLDKKVEEDSFADGDEIVFNDDYFLEGEQKQYQKQYERKKS